MSSGAQITQDDEKGFVGTGKIIVTVKNASDGSRVTGVPVHLLDGNNNEVKTPVPIITGNELILDNIADGKYTIKVAGITQLAYVKLQDISNHTFVIE